MRTTLKGILIVVVLLASAGQAFAYPPDNAAVLYYKSFMLLEEPNENLKKILSDLSKGNIGLNEQIRQYIEKNRKVIKDVVTAAEIRNCDWGLDFSEGWSMLLPDLSKCRQMAYILSADVKILAEKGDYGEALERCITIHNMGIHIGDDTIVQGLVNIAIGGLANRSIIDILPQVSENYEMLKQLRWRLVDLSNRHSPFRTAIAKEGEFCWKHINREEREEIVAIMSALDVNDTFKDKLDKVLQGDDEFFAKSREYWYNVMTRMQSILDLPYQEAYQKAEDLNREVENAAKEKPEAIITGLLFSSIYRVIAIEARHKTHLNAVLAGIDIYLLRAKTGTLPDEMPAGLPKDLFSGKDFLYEKTDAGFILKCQGNDPAFDTVHQYKFKVAK